MASPTEDPTLLLVGRVGSVHGVRGAVKIHSQTHPKEQILNYLPWLIRLNHQWSPLKILSSQYHGHMLVVHFEGYTDRDQAKMLTGADIAVNKAQLASLPTGEYYWTDLIGLTVYTVEGVELGAVTSLLETGSNDVLVVKQGKKERLIPYLPDQFIKQINLAEKRMVVDWDPEF